MAKVLIVDDEKYGAYTFDMNEVIKVVKDTHKHYETAEQLGQIVVRDENKAL
jgi:glutamate/tyrosine decarboxylase-like PLP-dependent enzyme